MSEETEKYKQFFKGAGFTVVVTLGVIVAAFVMVGFWHGVFFFIEYLQKEVTVEKLITKEDARKGILPAYVDDKGKWVYYECEWINEQDTSILGCTLRQEKE